MRISNQVEPGKKTQYLQSIVECKVSTPGIKQGMVRTNNKKCPQRKSAAKSDISTNLTMNSLAGCEKACDPSPLPYHRP